jgi:hypothetical protein
MAPVAPANKPPKRQAGGLQEAWPHTCIISCRPSACGFVRASFLGRRVALPQAGFLWPAGPTDLRPAVDMVRSCQFDVEDRIHRSGLQALEMRRSVAVEARQRQLPPGSAGVLARIWGTVGPRLRYAMVPRRPGQQAPKEAGRRSAGSLAPHMHHFLQTFGLRFRAVVVPGASRCSAPGWAPLARRADRPSACSGHGALKRVRPSFLGRRVALPQPGFLWPAGPTDLRPAVDMARPNARGRHSWGVALLCPRLGSSGPLGRQTFGL